MGIKAVPEESAGLNPHIKEGIYLGRLAGVTERVLEVPKLDESTGREISREDVPRWDWTFGVRTSDGDLKMTVLTSPKMTTKSKAFAFTKALKGSAPELGVELDIDTELVGKYAQLTVKDKARKDRTGNVQVTSEITDMLPVDKPPEKEISIEGLVEEPEPEEPVPAPKTGAKKKK